MNTIEVFPAINGDSILLRLNGYNMLIDGGYVNTYNSFIKPRLLEISSKNQILNHLVVSHIDKDHISGVIKLIQENRDDSIIKIGSIWHNSLKHIKNIGENIDIEGNSISNLKTTYNLSIENYGKEKNISAEQGSTLASLLIKNNYNWNAEFKGIAVCNESNSEVTLSDKINLKLLSPNHKKLSALKKDWQKELYIKGYATNENMSDFQEEAFEFIIQLQKENKKKLAKNISSSIIKIEELSTSPFVEDSKSANGSSISFIIEDENRKYLFLADSHPSLIISNLKNHYSSEDFPVFFDFIKVSHHGSCNNTNNELLKLIDSDKFIFSTNGKVYNHPDLETIARIICRPSKVLRNLYFNYTLEKLKPFLSEKIMRKYNYNIIQSGENKPLIFNF